MVADHQGCEHESQLRSLKAIPILFYGNFCPLLSRFCWSSIGRGAIVAEAVQERIAVAGAKTAHIERGSP